jgi:UDPglucose 6-dehydrogenase
MNIGIIGLGVVGNAVKIGMEKIGHRVSVYDIKLPKTSIESIRDSECCFICVPTPLDETGSCDVSAVERTVRDLKRRAYAGVVVIKSTVTPGTTDRLAKETCLRMAFCPEFLREREAVSDFVEHQDVCVIGTHNPEAFDVVARAHGGLPKGIVRLTPVEAELSKYFSNVYNALRIVFANEFYEVCKAMDADYAPIKNAMVKQRHVEDWYLECNDNFRGFGGVCLPKDTKAFAALVKRLKLDLDLFDLIVRENKKFKTTIPDGMRDV